MEFSMQDSRYKAQPPDLSEYSAADMRADLGIHRRISLPLQGRTSTITPPPPDIHKRGPLLARMVERDASALAAWGCVYDPDLEEARDDGLGAGQMHRTGANFNPDEVRQGSSPPPRLRRMRSEEGSEDFFGLGRRPTKPLRPRRERRRDGSLNALDFNSDLLAELRAESKIRMSKYRPSRPAGKIVSHHIASNQPAPSRAPGAARSLSTLPYASPRVIPLNPFASQWTVGTKLATAKAGYDYALDLDSKKAKGPPNSDAPQERAFNKINSDAPQERAFNKINSAASRLTNPATRISSILDPEDLPPDWHEIPPGSISIKAPSATTAPTYPHPNSFPDPTKLHPINRTEGTSWAGDKPFGVEAEQRLAEGTNSIKSTPGTENTNTLPTKPGINSLSVPLNSAIEQDVLHPGGSSTDLGSIDEISHHALRSKDSLDQASTTTKIEGSDSGSKFAARPRDNSGIISAPKSLQSKEGVFCGSNEVPDQLEELLMDIRAISKAIKKLKIKYLEFEEFEKSLTVRVHELRRLKKDVLHEIQVDEDMLLGIRREITILRAKRIAVTEAVRVMKVKKVVPKVDVQKMWEQGELVMEAMPQATMSKRRMLTYENIMQETEDFDVADIEWGMEGSVGAEYEEEEKEEESTSKKESIGKGEPAMEKLIKNSSIKQDTIIKDEYAEKEEIKNSRYGDRWFPREARRSENTRVKTDNSKKVGVEKKEARLQKAPTTEYLPKEKKHEPNHLAADPPREEQKAHHIQERAEKAEADRILRKEELKQDHAKAKRAEALLEQERITKEAEDRQRDEQAKKERFEKAHAEKIHLDKQRLARERNEADRIEATHLKQLERAHAENIRLEEARLVREHIQKVCDQEESSRAERAENDRLRMEDRARFGAEELLRETEATLAMEKIEKRSVDLRKIPEGGQLEASHPAAELAPTPTPKSATCLTSPTSPIAGAARVSQFPYTLQLDLRPMYGPQPLHIELQQSDMAEAKILECCKEALGLAEYRALSEIGEFQKFLSECNDSHNHKIAKATRER